MKPKIRLAYTAFQKLVTGFAAALVLAVFAYLILAYPSLPERLPTHFGFDGKPDAWGGKDSLWFLAAASAALFLLIAFCSHFPAIWNLPATLTDRNREIVWRKTRNMLCVLSLLIVLLFGYLFYCSVNAMPVGVWLLPVVLAASFLGLPAWVVYIYRVIKRE